MARAELKRKAFQLLLSQSGEGGDRPLAGDGPRLGREALLPFAVSRGLTRSWHSWAEEGYPQLCSTAGLERGEGLDEREWGRLLDGELDPLYSCSDEELAALLRQLEEGQGGGGGSPGPGPPPPASPEQLSPGDDSGGSPPQDTPSPNRRASFAAVEEEASPPRRPGHPGQEGKLLRCQSDMGQGQESLPGFFSTGSFSPTRSAASRSPRSAASPLGASTCTPGSRSRSGFEYGSKYSSGSSLASPLSLTSARSPLHRTASAQLKAHLLTKAPSIAAAWRVVLDPLGSGAVTRNEFHECCRRVHFKGNARDAWTELDADGSGKVTLSELDWRTAEALGGLVAALEGRHGSVAAAASELGFTGGRRYRREEFCQLLISKRMVAEEAQAEALFEMLTDSRATKTVAKACVQATVARQDLDWLASIGPTLPRPASCRVQPGSLSTAAATTELEADSCMSGSDDEDGAASVASCPPQETVFRKLQREALEYHERRNGRDAARLCTTSPRSPPERAPSAEAIGKLHMDHIRQMYKRHEFRLQETLRECPVPAGKVRTQRDPENWARLLRVKEPRAPEPAAWEQRPPPPDPASGEKAAARLFEESQFRAGRAHDRAQAALKAQEDEEKAHPKVGTKLPSKKAADEVIRRLHTDEVNRRRAKLEQLRHAAEEEELSLTMEMSSTRGSRTPGAVSGPSHTLKLHLDHFQREQAREEKRAQREHEERKALLSDTIHRKRANDGKVYYRLFQSYNRHLGPDGVDRTRGWVYVWAEEAPLDPDHPDYCPTEGDFVEGDFDYTPAPKATGLDKQYVEREDDEEAQPWRDAIVPAVREAAAQRVGLRSARDQRLQRMREEEELKAKLAKAAKEARSSTASLAGATLAAKGGPRGSTLSVTAPAWQRSTPRGAAPAGGSAPGGRRVVGGRPAPPGSQRHASGASTMMAFGQRVSNPAYRPPARP